MDDSEARLHAERVESLLTSLDDLADPAARETAAMTVQEIVGLYGEALSRFMEHIARGGTPELLDTVVGDELITNLLLVHGLHPFDLPARTQRALETVEDALAAQGVRAELRGIEAGIAHVVLRGKSDARRSSGTTMRHLIEDTLWNGVPDLARIEIEDARAPALSVSPTKW